MAIQIVKNKTAPTKEEIKGKLVLGPAMLVIGALILIFASYPKYKLARDSKSWTRTEGTIIATNIVVHKKGSPVQQQDKPEFYSGEEDIRYRVDITYEYKVGEDLLKGYRKDLMQQDNEGETRYKRAKKLEKYYLENNKVAVYYNPQQPSECVLIPGLGFGQWLLILSPLLMILIGIPVSINGIRFTLFPPDPSKYQEPKTFSGNFKE